MANHTTGAQRRNARMEKIFERAKSEGRGLVGNSHVDGSGVNSSAMKSAKHKALESRTKKGFRWGDSKTECNMCSKTTKHTHYR